MLRWNPNPNPDALAEPQGEISHPEEFQNHASLKIVAKDGMRILQKHYPGHMWAIQINERGRMFNVFNHALHDVWGYTIRADEVEHDPKRRKFLVAGGEILERFCLRPGKFDVHAYAALPKDIKGRCIPIIDDLEHQAARKEIRKRKLVAALEAQQYITDSNGRILVAVN